MGIKSLFGFGQARDKPVRNYSNGEYTFNFGRSTSGKSVNEMTAMQTTAVYACVRILSEAIASLPIHVYRYKDGGKEMVCDHPLYTLLHDEPNPEMISFVFRETLMSHLLIWGNAYAQIIRNGKGEVLSLYPLLPNKMSVERDSNGVLYYVYSRYTDENPNMKKMGDIILRQEDVLHIPGLGFDGLIGYSPIAMARNAVGMTMACEEYGASFFANGANPGGVLEHPGVLKDPAKVRDSSVLQKKRVCAYARVSTDSRRQEDSLENQMETYERMITGNPEYEFIGVFADQGISGYCENRPQFQRMMEKARAGEIDLIITKSISRFARNTVTVLKFARELKELGVGIFFEEQNINTLSGDGEMMLAVLASFAQEESRSMSENNKWSIRKKFERGEVMITTSRFLGYDKNEYGDLIVNRKEAEIVSLTFDLYLLNVGSSRIGELLDYLGVKTVTGTTWESGTINGMLCNEKYKGDFHLQKYYTPENKRNHTRKNNGEVQSYYISENHEPIVSPEVWEKVQEVREQRKRDRNIGQDSTMKFQNRYPLSGMLICPYCGKTLRRRQVYKKKIQWLCSTYIEKGVKACKGIRIDDAELQGLNITEQTVIEEVVKNGKKHYCYTSKADFDCGIRNSAVSAEIEDGSVLPSINRPRRTVIKL